jgi:hypothetical protein
VGKADPTSWECTHTWALPIIKYEANLNMKKSVDHEAWEGKGSHIYKEEYFPYYIKE